MPDHHRPATPQVSVVDDQFGTHKLQLTALRRVLARHTVS